VGFLRETFSEERFPSNSLPNLFNLCSRFVELIWERKGKRRKFSVEFG